MGTMRKIVRIWVCCLAVLLSAGILCLPMAQAQQTSQPRQGVGTQYGLTAQLGSGKQPRVVRVGFFIQKGLMEKDEAGQYTGYTVDFLNEIQRYTNWTIEYVEVEGDINTQISTLCNMLRDGEIDLMGTMNYSEALAEMYLYPTYSYGTSCFSIAVAEDSETFIEGDYSNWNGMTVAVYPGFSRRLSQLEQFAQVNGFTFKTVEYETYDQVIEAVLKGEVDATLQKDISVHEGLRSVGRFSPEPFYFAVAPDEHELLQDLNNALSNLLRGYPHLESELYNKYFTNQGKFMISEDLRQYIQSLGVQRVLFFQGNTPIQDGDARTQEASGVAKSYFDQLSAVTGLQYEPVIATSYAEGVQLALDGAVDLVAAVPANATLGVDVSLVITQPYFEAHAVLVSAPYDEGGPNPKTARWLVANCLNELGRLNASRNESTYMDSYIISHYLQKQGLYSNLHLDWSDRQQVRYSVGIAGEVDQRLVTLLNNYASSITEETCQEMLYNNTPHVVHYTLLEIIRLNIWQVLAVVLVLVMVAAVIVIRNVQGKNRMLRQVNQFNERFKQFSEMLNECLFEYDYDQDCMEIGNNSLFFVGLNQVEGFTRMGEQGKLSKQADGQVHAALCQALEQRKDCSVDLQVDLPGGQRWYRILMRYLPDEQGGGGTALGRLLDVNDEVMRDNALRKQAKYDAFTGLLNRSSVQEWVSEYLANGRRVGVLLLLDIDNFKNVNDTMGHPEGDTLLKQLAGYLSTSFRATDIKGRLGGDEFVVFMPGDTPEPLLKQKLRTTIDELNRLVFAPYRHLGVSISVGAAYVTPEIEDYAGLYKQADNAMYVAKQGGKNDFFISDGSSCMEKDCGDCERTCKRRTYLAARGKSELVEQRREPVRKAWREPDVNS